MLGAENYDWNRLGQPADVDVDELRETLEMFRSVFGIKMDAYRDELFVYKTLRYTHPSIRDAIRHVASTQGDEFHKLDFDRALTKITSRLKERGELVPLPKDSRDLPFWWGHGVPVSLLAQHNRRMYGWLRWSGNQWSAILYYKRGDQWGNVSPKNLEDLEHVPDGPQMPEPKARMTTRLALSKYPRPDANVTGRSVGGIMTGATLWYQEITRYLASLPGGDKNVVAFKDYQGWANRGYPSRPLGWEAYCDANKTPY